MKITKALLVLLFFLLPLIHGKIFETLGITVGFSVSGNFEFTKTIFFNIFSGFILLIFLLESFYSQRKTHIPPYVLLLTVVILLSTIFSLSPFQSLIGDTEKGHTALMFFNLLGIYTILRNLKKPFLQKLIITSVFSGIFVCLIAFKEYFFPSFDYGSLSNRAIGTFGHPNYLSGYLLLFVSLLFFSSNKTSPLNLLSSKERRTAYLKYTILCIFLFTLLLTKSVWALFLVILCVISQVISPSPLRRGLGGGLIGLLGIIGILLLIFFSPEKLHSFLSRFYLWETTFKIILSDWKILFFGGGAETLPYFFNSFKVPELYIFENFGYTADRPHNFLLNIFYHFGIFWLSIVLYLIYAFFKKFKKTPEGISILLFLFYGIFHYFSIASYVVIVLTISILQVDVASFYKGSSPKGGWIQKIGILTGILSFIEGKGLQLLVLLGLSLTSVTGAYFSTKLYHAEMLYAKGQVREAQQTFSHPKYLRKIGRYEEGKTREGLLSQNNLKSQIQNTPHKFELCNTLTNKYPSVENLFFCGNVFEELGKDEIAKKFHTAGLNKLPDLWSNNSPYLHNYFVKQTITGNRFFSPKFGNIPHILEYLEIENNYIK